MRDTRKSEVTLTLTRDKIRETYELSPEMKLLWLEEANEFVHSIRHTIQRKQKKT
jgi:hypothetical protein